MASIVWFRNDLRLGDNAALQTALRSGGAVIPLFIHAPEEEEPWAPRAASRWWLHQSLLALDVALKRRGSRLVIRRGPSLEALRSLARETGASAVYWSRRYEPAVLARDGTVKEALLADSLTVKSFGSSLLFEPGTIRNQSGKPFQVFAAFWRACLKISPPGEPASTPQRLPAPGIRPKSLDLSEFDLLPHVDWAAGMRESWRPGEEGALAELKRFLAEALPTYPSDRDRPDRMGTSRLSPHLHFGEISPRQIWHTLGTHLAKDKDGRGKEGSESYLRQIGWREFAHHLLYHFPHTATEPLRSEFSTFPWRSDPLQLTAWKRGRTGYPIVDAGMRELWSTGWMHNRVRMVVASFLVKDLRMHWREGADWFWDTLVDADLANNTLGWQWTSGCGADAAPYFRIFNPVMQGEKFDPDGAYVRRWAPELAGLAPGWIHKPWLAPPRVLSAAGLKLGETYPAPIVDHGLAREEALAALQQIRG